MPLIPPNRITAFPLKDDLAWYDPEVIFQPFDDIFGRGVIGSGDLQVVANSPADGQVLVKAGRGYVPYQSGGKRSFQTKVDIRSDAPEFQRAVGAYSGTPRIDRLVAKVLDATLNPPDSLKGGVFDVIPGTPTAGATLANLSGAASVPSTALLLANLLSGAATIPDANIDTTFPTIRARAIIGAGNSPNTLKKIYTGGTVMPDRGGLNLIAGTGISISGADNSGADRSDVTITNTQPAPTMPMVKFYDVAAASAKSNFDTYTDTGNTLLPQTYAVLVIRGRVQSTASQADTAIQVNFNNDFTTDYDYVTVWEMSDGNTGADYGAPAQTTWRPIRFNAASSSNGWGMFEIVIVDYASTVSRMLMFANGADSGTVASRRFRSSCTWHGSAISRVNISPGAGNFATGSRIMVYGIL